MNLFNFDEEELSTSFEEITLNKYYENDKRRGDEENEKRDGQLQISQRGPGSYRNEEKLSISISPYQRRRSSVYGRVSVRLPSSVSSHTQELTIPPDYDGFGNEQHPEDFPIVRKKKLSDFEPLRVLGQGAFGKVHLVRDKQTSKLFAQKQVRKPAINVVNNSEAIRDPSVSRTISERQILAKISHISSVVKLFFALQDSDKFYLMLEYIPGGELFHHLASHDNKLGNAFKEEDVAFYAAEMAIALMHLHKLGVVYRDLKPENCLLDAQGHLVLTDFGLSKTISDDSTSSCTSIIGTPEYMAPEILKGGEYGFLVDWWSLGCVIYDMMSGRAPFTGNSHKAIQNKILKDKLKIPFYFSLDAKDLLQKLLNKNPNKRFDVDAKWDQFQKHRFFRKLNWSFLEYRHPSCVPPIVPEITDPSLAENFDPQFTSMRVSDINNSNLSQTPISLNDPFQGFSYTASSSFIEKFC